MKYDSLEVSKVMGQPLDPRKPYPEIVTKLCQTDVVEPGDYYYSYDALVDTDKIYVITSNGAVTQENVIPDTPALLSFADIATPEYYIKLTDFADRKESMFARKNKTINRALNAYEIYKVMTLLGTAASGVSHTVTLGSGYTRFSYPHVISMLEQVQDYGDNFKLVLGATCHNDLTLWDWNDNKYASMLEAFAMLNVEKIRLSLAGSAAQFSVDADNSGGVVATDLLSATAAYMVAVDSELGAPILFVRKKLDSIAMLGGVISENGEAPQRLILVGSNPVTVTSTARYLAVSIQGYEQIAAAVVNPYACSSFSRS